MNRNQKYQKLSRQLEYVSKLSDDIKDVLSWYTGDNSDSFNQELRSGFLSELTKKKLKFIDIAFFGVPTLNESLTVFKGIETDSVYSDRAFMSTSILYSMAKDFTGVYCCMLKITISPGSKVLPLRSISRKPYEEEILLNRDGHLQVTGTEIVNNFKIIFATYLPQKSIEVKNENEVQKAQKSFDKDIIINRIVDIYKDEDPDFIDDTDISLTFKRMTKKEIPPNILKEIKLRLKLP